VAAIPLDVEDPDVAWSRVGGDWHQVHVEYPTRFGYGERPLSVLVNGVLRSLLWAAIAFVVLPIVVDVVWKEGSDALGNTGKAATVGFVAAFAVFAAVFGAIGAVVLVRLADGVIRAYRGGADLRTTVTVSGQVVKHHQTEELSWFAVDPGDVDEVRAFHPGDDGEMPPRGATVPMVITPHLRHVVSVLRGKWLRQDQASASPRSTTDAPGGASHTGFGNRSMPCSARSAKYASLSTGTGRTSSP
jgi:hypothetical protein